LRHDAREPASGAVQRLLILGVPWTGIRRGMLAALPFE
jgi:hypothetical protein